MRDDEHGAAFHQGVHAGLHDGFRAGIDGGRRFVENHDGRVCNGGAGDGNELYQSTIEDREWLNAERNVLTEYNCSEAKGLAALQAGVARYGQALVEKKSFACMMELLYKLYRCGCTFAEVPFTLYYDSKEGESKMNLGKTIRDSFLTALRLRVRE